RAQVRPRGQRPGHLGRGGAAVQPGNLARPDDAGRQRPDALLLGGVARPQSYELTGPLATGVLEQVTLDVAILGVDGIDAVAGATAHHEGEASINRLMGQRAGRVIVVADSSKVGRRAFARI
ncbi:MAG TPA: alkaline phosphatase, partial [Streptosporangiaceae bacterium]|nr:alkaline phosphatase [Streptosporangiaceae bacterium]